MGRFSNHSVTLAGRRVLAKAWAEDRPLKVLRMEIGDGVAPVGIEALEGLVNRMAVVPISTKRDLGGGKVAIRGVFKPHSIVEGFFFRELGVFVEGEGGAEVLFSYANSGELADFLAPAEASSLTDEVITACLIAGSAEVLVQDIDPNAAMTVQDVRELFEDLDMDRVREEIRKAGEEIERIKEEIDASAAGFVKKSGDVMEGLLEAKAGVKGDVDGSARLWSGWRVFDSLEALGAFASEVSGSVVSFEPESVAVGGAAAAMPLFSRLVAFIGVSNELMPGIGMLDLQKQSDRVSVGCFTGVDGRSWRGAVYNGVWTGWMGCNEVPAGVIMAFDGDVAPVGFVLNDGRWLDPYSYPGLFAVVGYRYGQNGRLFRVLDLRGVVLRGKDGNRGLDPGRVLGSYQEDAQQNIMGTFDSNSDDGDWGKSGAFYRTSTAFAGANGSGTPAGALCGFDSSRVVRVSHEVRMKNVAVNFIQKY